MLTAVKSPETLPERSKFSNAAVGAAVLLLLWRPEIGGKQKRSRRWSKLLAFRAQPLAFRCLTNAVFTVAPCSSYRGVGVACVACRTLSCKQSSVASWWDGDGIVRGKVGTRAAVTRIHFRSCDFMEGRSRECLAVPSRPTTH